MSRDKKDANAALSELSKYLHRDRAGMCMLESIKRYRGELRRKNSAIKNECDHLSDNVDNSRANYDRLSVSVMQLTSLLDKERAIRHQACSDLKKTQATVEVLKERLEQLLTPADFPETPPETQNTKRPESHERDVPCPLYKDITGYSHLLKALVRRMSRAPEIDAKTEVAVIRLEDIIKEYKDTDYRTLGMFVTVSCMAGFPVGFRSKGSFDGKCDKDLLAPFIHWVKGWIHLSKTSDKCYGEVAVKGEPRPYRYLPNVPLRSIATDDDTRRR